MTELNEDGLKPGQSVDWETLTRVNAERKEKPVAPQPEAPRRGRPPMVRDNG